MRLLTKALCLGAGGLLSACAVAATCNWPIRYAESPWGVSFGQPAMGEPEFPAALSLLRDAGFDAVRAHEAYLYRWSADLAGFSETAFLKKAVNNAFPLDIEGVWKPYVANAFAKSRLADVRDWAVWNEPPLESTDTDPAHYAALVQGAHAVAAGSGRRIGLAAVNNHLGWLRDSIRLGAAGHYDFLSLHPYELAARVHDGHEALFMALAPNAQRLLADLGEPPAPIQLTELGVPQVNTAVPALSLSPEEQADVAVKLLTLSLAQGIARVHWYQGADSMVDDKGLGLLGRASDHSHVPTPALGAVSRLRAELGARPVYLGWLLLNTRHYGFVFEGQGADAGRLKLLSWTSPEQIAPSFKPLSALTAVQLLSGQRSLVVPPGTASLSRSPLLLVAPADEAQGLAWRKALAANCGKAFPWHGDYSKPWITTVNLLPQAGDRSRIEKGLHTERPLYVDLGNGDWALDPEGADGPPRSQVNFAVDPSFLPYSVQPQRIRITTQVRLRNPAQGARFGVLYESPDAPHARAGGASLPAGSTAWRTFSWEIPDAQFAARWGHHFVFVRESATANYLIGKVSVTRLPP